MHSCCEARWPVLVTALCGFLAATELALGQVTNSVHRPDDIYIVASDGVVEISTDGGNRWIQTKNSQELKPGDLVRTGPNSRVSIQWTKDSFIRLGAATHAQIRDPHKPGALPGLRLLEGILSFFHRNKPSQIEVLTSGGTAGVKGTEFVMQVETVNGVEQTTLSVIDGIVSFSNPLGPPLTVSNMQEAIASPTQAPRYTAGFVANNRLQWCFYYPGILDLRDLPLTPAEETALADSLRAYRVGDLLGALRSYSAGPQPGSDAERLYYAAVLLSVGRVSQTETILAGLTAGGAEDRIQRLATALRVLIAAVKREPNPSTRVPELSTELLAASYYEQSLAVREESLQAALKLAKQAAANSPAFGFAWERVAELEFSFGRIDRATQAFEKSYALSPRNAEALALQGFLLAAENKTKEAIVWFQYAIDADSSLGNAWLGRGLCRIHRGDLDGGREDLLVAAALEPQRALLRSYLGKAYADQNDYPRAAKELDRAKYLDRRDPTPWLYSALLNQEHNRINEAIRDLEHSQESNENRSVYRSALLLDQDQAVRSANLATVYRDAGMFDVSVREASRAVNYDYGNYSAHLFLAGSYQQLSDPKLINLRYETATEVEYLLANLLAPVGAAPLSQTISQQEYSKLFERDHLGLISSTEYSSHGDWEQSGAQYGTFGGTAYSLEGFYRSERGWRPNNDLEQRQLSFFLKQQLTPKDSIFVQAIDTKLSGGDLFQYYDQSSAAPDFRFRETQDPILLLGYHREWSPGVHTLLLATRLTDKFSFTNTTQPTLLGLAPVGPLAAAFGLSMHEDFTAKPEIYTAELQQIWEQETHNTIAGARFQYGHFETMNLQNESDSFAFVFPDPAALQHVSPLFKRLSLYAYHYWQVAPPLQLIAGLTYDNMTFPENVLTAPISENVQTAERLSPKAGLIFTPLTNTTVPFAYTRSLSGASLDQSVQLEPSQLAGFLQSFRSIIPESVAGPTPGAHFETFGLSLEQKFSTGTYIGASGEILNSDGDRTQGAFVSTLVNGLPSTINSGFRENLNFKERSLILTLNQLIGDQCSVGASYKLTKAELTDEFVDIPSTIPTAGFQGRQNLDSVLQQLSLNANYYHPIGFFAQFQALWSAQTNEGVNSS